MLHVPICYLIESGIYFKKNLSTTSWNTQIAFGNRIAVASELATLGRQGQVGIFLIRSSANDSVDNMSFSLESLSLPYSSFTLLISSTMLSSRVPISLRDWAFFSTIFSCAPSKGKIKVRTATPCMNPIVPMMTKFWNRFGVVSAHVYAMINHPIAERIVSPANV